MKIRIAGALVGLGLLLAGCTSEQAADPVFPSTVSATTTAVSTTESSSTPTLSTTMMSSSSSVVETSSVESSTALTELSFDVSVVPTTVAPELAADLDAAIAAYQGASEVDRLSSASPGGDWTPEIRKYSGDPYAAQRIEALSLLAEKKLSSAGPITYTTSVVSVESNRIVLSTCVDNSALVFFQDGVEIDATKPNGDRFLQTATLYKNVQSATGWLVSEVTNAPTPC